MKCATARTCSDIENRRSALRNAARNRSKQKEAPPPSPRQSPSMNYNNFSCRVVIPRSPAVARPEVSPKPPAKKMRRVSRPRLTAVVSTIAMGLVMFAGSVCSSEAAGLRPAELRTVPAPQTFPFKEVAWLPVSDESSGEAPDAPAFSTRLETLTAQVSNLTATSIRAANPAGAMGLSLMTKVLLCGGLGVAVAQMRLLFRADLRC